MSGFQLRKFSIARTAFIIFLLGFLLSLSLGTISASASTPNSTAAREALIAWTNAEYNPQACAYADSRAQKLLMSWTNTKTCAAAVHAIFANEPKSTPAQLAQAIKLIQNASWGAINNSTILFNVKPSGSDGNTITMALVGNQWLLDNIQPLQSLTPYQPAPPPPATPNPVAVAKVAMLAWGKYSFLGNPKLCVYLDKSSQQALVNSTNGSFPTCAAYVRNIVASTGGAFTGTPAEWTKTVVFYKRATAAVINNHALIFNIKKPGTKKFTVTMVFLNGRWLVDSDQIIYS